MKCVDRCFCDHILSLSEKSAAAGAEPQPLAAQCPSCGNKEAFFLEIQTRSADEPASLFFRCAACGHRWREG